MHNLGTFKILFILKALMIICLHAESNSLRIFGKREAKSQTNLCLFIYCQNGGTCFYSNNLAHCKCAQGFSGMWCQFVSAQKQSTQRQIQNYIMTPMIPQVITPAPSFFSESESLIHETQSEFSICSVVKCQNGYS